MSVREESTLMKNKNHKTDVKLQRKSDNRDSDPCGLNLSALYVLLAGSLWGFMGLLVRTLNEASFNSMEITFIRSVVTLAVMFVGLLIFNKKAFRIKIKDIWCFIGTGGFSVAFFNFCYFKTMTLTSLSVAAVLLYTAPAFVMLMSAFLFKETFSAKKLLALLLAFLGCAFVSGIVGGAGTLSGAGILYGLGAGFGYALYSIFGRYALERNYSSVTISFYTFACSSIATLLFVDAGDLFTVLCKDGILMAKTVMLVLVVTLFPYLFYTKGLNKMENGTASVLASIEPVVATLVGMIVYKEALNLWNIIGIVLVLGSIILINLNKKK